MRFIWLTEFPEVPRRLRERSKKIMTPEQYQTLLTIERALHAVQAAQMHMVARDMVELARNEFRVGNVTVAVAILESAIGMNDPFYSTQALTNLSFVYRSIGNHEKLQETYQRIARLPESNRKFVGPTQMGATLTRIGKLGDAASVYKAALFEHPSDAFVLSNYAELLLLTGDFQQAKEIAERLQRLPSLRDQLFGRLFKGTAAYLLGEIEAAEADFRWLGDWIASLGSLPPDCDWDFSDASAAWSKLKSPAASPWLTCSSEQSTTKLSLQSGRSCTQRSSLRALPVRHNDGFRTVCASQSAAILGQDGDKTGDERDVS